MPKTSKPSQILFQFHLKTLHYIFKNKQIYTSRIFFSSFKRQIHTRMYRIVKNRRWFGITFNANKTLWHPPLEKILLKFGGNFRHYCLGFFFNSLHFLTHIQNRSNLNWGEYIHSRHLPYDRKAWNVRILKKHETFHIRANLQHRLLSELSRPYSPFQLFCSNN